MSLNIDSKIYTKHGLQFNCLTYVLLTIYFVIIWHFNCFSWWLWLGQQSHHFRRMTQCEGRKHNLSTSWVLSNIYFVWKKFWNATIIEKPNQNGLDAHRNRVTCTRRRGSRSSPPPLACTRKVIQHCIETRVNGEARQPWENDCSHLNNRYNYVWNTFIEIWHHWWSVMVG